jgi:phosphoribosylformimino-5-aminoimidazole carboxamide ribotide isomerase
LSLDLRAGVTVESKGAIATGTPAREAAARAAAAGVGTIIVLDLARVGQSAGCDLRTVEEVRRAAPQVELLVGGGVRDEDDLERLARAGCDGALVATALLSGTLRLRPSRHAPP